MATESLAIGVTSALGAEATLVPKAFVAVTVNVYDVPLVSSVTTHALVEVVHVNPPGVDVAVYAVITEPPVLAGVSQRTATRVSPAVAVTDNGAVGAVAAERGVTVTMADAGLSPNRFTAFTRKDTGTSGVILVRVAVTAVETSSFHVDHAVAVSARYSMT
jgi:hypothetical protein